MTSDVDDFTLRRLYEELLRARLIEERMLLLLRKGEISKWFSGIGQEGISVGATLALRDEEYILPLHRNLGVFTSRGIPLDRLFKQFQGKARGYTKGRDRSFHFGSNKHHIAGMISHLGTQLAVADGIALGAKLAGEQSVTLVFCGDGATSEGEFHEALNIASVWDLPVLFLIENNQYGLSTPAHEQYRCKQLVDRAVAYGMEGRQVDGNSVLEVYTCVKDIADSIRKNPRPVLLECVTFRMRGHEEASGVKYVPKALIEKWSKKDPVDQFENYLLSNDVLTNADLGSVRKSLDDEISAALEEAFSDSLPVANMSNELRDVYAPYDAKTVDASSKRLSSRRFVDAISDALRISMRKHSKAVILGQDVADYGGVFKVTEGMLKEFGAQRVRNTPLCESAILGAALGLSICGYKSIVEMQFSDFVACGFNEIINNLAKVHYRWGQNADVVIRMPTGAGVRAGPFHSQSTEAWFFHTPGLKIVYPSSPYDAKGLLLSAIEDPNPVMYFEHKALYRSLTEDVPDEYYTIEIGKARVVQSGTDVAIVTYGQGVHWALEVLRQNSDISAYVLDLRSLQPLDYDAINEAIMLTGRVIVLHEDTLTGGIGADIAAYISENLFEYLDAPVLRCASLDTPVPFCAPLEDEFLAKARLEGKLLQLVNY